MNDNRLKVDFLLVFWGFLVILNLISTAVSWYIGDLTNYWYCVIMLLYSAVGLYFSLPSEDKDE